MYCIIIAAMRHAPDGPNLRAIRAWVRLDRAFDGFNAYLEKAHNVTGVQLAMLRIVAEQQPVTLHALRAQLVMHPATIGQLIDRVVKRGLLARRRAADDSRRRVLELTAAGRRLLATAPLAGPVRLRTTGADASRIRRLAAALEDAVNLFGLEEWAP
jgi:DNA-binding MarR family transcriptional regulator